MNHSLRVAGWLRIIQVVLLVGLCFPSGPCHAVEGPGSLEEPREGNDWWPALNHDTLNSGYSSSTIPDNPVVLWALPPSENQNPDVAVLNGKVCAVIGTGISCFDAVTGHELWHAEPGWSVELYRAPAMAGDYVYIGSYRGWSSSSGSFAKIFCLHSESGDLVWSAQHNNGGGYYNSVYVFDPRIHSDQVVYTSRYWEDYGGSHGVEQYCRLHIRDRLTGVGLLELEFDIESLQSISFVSGKDLYVTAGAYLKKFDARDGSLVWEAYNSIGDAPVIHGNRIIGGHRFSEHIYCLDTSDGQVQWTYDAYVSGLPAVHEGRAYLGLGDGRFICFDMETGEEIWARLYDPSRFSGVSLGIGRLLVITTNYATDEDHLRCLDTETGDELWAFPLDVDYSERPVAIADGRIYVATVDHAVICIGEAPLTVSGMLNCNPVSGTLPFQTNMSLTLHNSYLNQSRQGAVSIAVTLSNGTWFPNWRSGYTNLQPGESRVLLWQTTILDYPPLVGENTFQLLVEDVTPAPYNQPPYPPAGDTCTDLAVVTGVSP